MINIKEVYIPEQKAHICNAILRALPRWFGVEASIVDYVNDTQAMPFWAAFDSEKPIGFIALKAHNRYTSEVFVMGILKEYHRKGVGRKLIDCCETFCIANKIEFITVKTLDETRASRSYENTRQFYLAMGFRPLEVLPLFWDKDNPCLFMAKYLHQNS